MILKTHLIAHFAAEFIAAFPRNAGGDRACCDPAGLENHDSLRTGNSGVQQHLRDLRGLPRARGSYEDELVAAREGAGNIVVELPDWQTVIRHGEEPSRMAV